MALYSALWMDLDIVILSEIKSDRAAVSYDIPYMWNLKRNDIKMH